MSNADGEFDFYETLDVSRTATPEEIRNGYLTMSRIHHPDKKGETETFRNVNRAYKILSDPTLRSFYDKHGFEPTLIAAAESTDLSAVSKMDDKLKYLESRVRAMIRSSEELRVQRFLQPSASISMGSRILSYDPFRYTWSTSSTNAGISLYQGGKLSVSVFQSSHVQRGGAAVSRASLILGAAFSPLLSGRSIVHLMGGKWPVIELMLQKQVTEETVLRQSFLVDEIFPFGISLSTEWIQQLGGVIVGTLGVTIGRTRGVSLELSKKIGGSYVSEIIRRVRGRVRIGIMSNGDVSIGGKAKYVIADGLEVHAGPQLAIGSGLSFEVAVQKELDNIVEEQEGAFPTYLQWSLGLQMPDEITVGVKITRGSFSFHFPVELPAPESRWVLVGILATWTFAPLIYRFGSKTADTVVSLSRMGTPKSADGFQNIDLE